MNKIYFQTHGCSTNVSESEIMMGLLNQAKFEIVKAPEQADILIINICTVKGEETALREIRKLHEAFPKKKLIVAGCITKIILNESREINDEISFISTHNIKSIVQVVEETINDNPVEATGRDEYKKINLPKLRKNPVIGVIPVLSGCANYCSYCSVKYVKGKLISYPIEDIKKEAMSCLDNGCKELWITSQDNAAYMLERLSSHQGKTNLEEMRGTSEHFDKEKTSKLPELINEVIGINKNFFVRIGMMNPSHLLAILPEMINDYKNEKVFKFLHVPVQSGNGEILRLMKRNYTVDDFRKIIAEFRKSIPNITISTDIIVGFPTETDEQFKDSLELIKEIKPDVLNISKFQARYGTDAAKMQGQVDGAIVKERSKMLTDIFHNIARMNNEKWLNWEGEVLIDEIGKNNTFVGRNFAYKPVIVRGDLKLGQIVKVKIEGNTSYDLRGEIINAR